MGPDTQLLIQLAIDSYQAGRIVDAIQTLQQVVHTTPENKAAVGLLGCYLYAHGDSRAAVPVLKRAVALSPKSELAARALFHALVDLGQTSQALEELDRYLDTGTSPELRREWDLLRNEALARSAKP